jgi:hypothetical protein
MTYDDSRFGEPIAEACFYDEVDDGFRVARLIADPGGTGYAFGQVIRLVGGIAEDPGDWNWRFRTRRIRMGNAMLAYHSVGYFLRVPAPSGRGGARARTRVKRIEHP